MEGTARPVPCPEVIVFPLDDEFVVHDSRTGENYILNPTAARIWSLCDGSSTVGSIARQIAADYQIGHETALADVQELLTRLDDVKLLNQHEPA